MWESIFKEQGKVDYELVMTLEGTILDKQSCDIPLGKEWRGMLNLYNLAIQSGYAPVSDGESVEAGSKSRPPPLQQA